MRPSVAAALALLALSSSGCFFKKKQAAPDVPPAPQRPPVELSAPKKGPPPQLEPPKVETPSQSLPQATSIEPTVIKPKLEKIEPPAPPPAATKRRRTTTKAAAKAKEQPPIPAPAAAGTTMPGETQAPPPTEAIPAAPTPLPTHTAPAPMLGEVMPEERRKALLASIEADLGAALKVLRDIEGRTLNSDQLESVNRVKGFVRQANEVRGSDISGATQLARRAAMLAEELAKTLQ